MNNSPANALARDATLIVFLAAAAMAVGWALNRTRSQPLPWLYRSPAARVAEAAAELEPRPVGAPDGAVREIGLPEFRALVAARSGLVLDARPAIFYGLGHVPGALNVAREHFARDYAAHRTALAAARSGPLAVYCAGPDCEDSRLVAEGLVKLGFRRVLVFRGGWEEWMQAGLSPAQG
jgi:rhodanese-related sulfurtransferase